MTCKTTDSHFNSYKAFINKFCVCYFCRVNNQKINKIENKRDKASTIKNYFKLLALSIT